MQGPARLKEWRGRRHQQQAADAIGIGLPKYNAYERGRERPGLDLSVYMQDVTGGYVRCDHWVHEDSARKWRSRAS